MGDETAGDLRALIDRAAIRDVIECYFHALDSADAEAMRSCFAAQSRIQFHTGTEGEFQQDGPEFAEYLIAGFVRHKARTHVTGTVQITLTGDTASVRTQAVAYLVDGDGSGHVRGLLYEDEFVRVGREWKIAFRRHTPKWQYDTQMAAPHVFQWARELAATLPKT